MSRGVVRIEEGRQFAIAPTRVGTKISDPIPMVLMVTQPGETLFAVEASYVEQEAGPLYSPYGDGEAVLREEDDARVTAERCRVAFPDGHPHYSKLMWRKDASEGWLEGYYDTLATKLQDASDGEDAFVITLPTTAGQPRFLNAHDEPHVLDQAAWWEHQEARAYCQEQELAGARVMRLSDAIHHVIQGALT